MKSGVRKTKEGFIDYIAKPIDAKKFESKVGSYIPKRLCRVVKENSDKIVNNNNLIIDRNSNILMTSYNYWFTQFCFPENSGKFKYSKM